MAQAGGHAERWGHRAQRPSLPPTPALPEPSARAHRPIPEETEHHPLTSIMRPFLICLPASTNLRESPEDTCIPWLFLSVLFQTSGKGRKVDFMGGAQNMSEVSSTTSKIAGELTARPQPMVGGKSNCRVNPELNQAPTSAFLWPPSALRLVCA